MTPQALASGEIRFVAEDFHHFIVASGLSEREQHNNGRWTDGKIVHLTFVLPTDTSDNILIKLDLQPFLWGMRSYSKS